MTDIVQQGGDLFVDAGADDAHQQERAHRMLEARHAGRDVQQARNAVLVHAGEPGEGRRPEQLD